MNSVQRRHFNSTDEIHTLGHLYESMLKEMRDAAGDSGEFYTPRAIVRFMVQAVNPRLGETVLDPAAGTGGFLVETFARAMRNFQRSGGVEVFLQSVHCIEQLVRAAESIGDFRRRAEVGQMRHLECVRQDKFADAKFGVLVENSVQHGAGFRPKLVEEVRFPFAELLGPLLPRQQRGVVGDVGEQVKGAASG